MAKKPEYDDALDVVIAELGDFGTNGEFFGQIRSYNGGPKKVAIYRNIKSKAKPGSFLAVPLFRLSLPESVLVGEFLCDVAAIHGIE